ncbi:MAG: hypothetical protein OHK0046_44860 [Anaerolineae bacterium]
MRKVSLFVLAFLVLAFIGQSPSNAVVSSQPTEDPVPLIDLSGSSSQIVLEGFLSVIHFDPAPGSGLPYYNEVRLTTADGSIYTLTSHYAQVRQYINENVQVFGRIVATPQSGSIAATVQVDELLPLGNEPQDEFFDVIAGNFNYINVLCRFSDSTGNPPVEPAYFDQLFSADYPGINHHWTTVSYGTVSLNGTETVSKWYTMSQPLSYYVSNPDESELANDCITASNADVDFSQYAGINFMFDKAHVGYALGTPGLTGTLDGVSRFWRVSWNPPFSWDTQYFISHEIGHTLNIPHSGGSTSDPNGRFPYDNFWDVMSGGGENNKLPDATLQYIGPGTTAAYMNIVGWIPNTRKVVVGDGESATATVERIAEPVSSTNPLMIQVPINNSTTDFYSVEVHFENGYDAAVPDTGVVIYLVDLDRPEDAPARVVDSDTNNDVNDAGAIWLPGETFTDAANNISISVESQGTSSFVISVNNDAGDVTPTPTTDPGATATPTATATATDDPSVTATPTATATTDPGVGGPLDRINPANNAVLTVVGDYPSKFQWTAVDSAQWYHVFVSEPDFSVVYFDKWYQAADVCTGTVCTTTDDIWLVGNGEFSWWMTYWNPIIGSSYTTLYEESTFTLNYPQPGNTTGIAPSGTVSGANIAVEWNRNPNALWYQLWIGPADYSDTILLQWIDASDTCNATICAGTLTGSALPAGSYEFWIQAWNPAGVTDWAKMTDFNVMP